MTLFSLATLRPDATLQTGLVSNTVAPSGTMHAALADSSDTTYVRLAARARLDGQVARLRLPTPSLPAGARVFAVGVRLRVRSVLSSAGQPVLLGWLRSVTGTVAVAGEIQTPKKLPFDLACPVDAVGGLWEDRDLGQFRVAPGNEAWDVATNLVNLTLDIGRGDDETSNLDIAAVYVDVHYQQVSTVTLTGPTTPNTSTRPVVTASYASPNLTPQQGYRVAIYTQPQTVAPGFVPFVTPAQYISGAPGSSADTSWWLLGEDLQWTPPGDLTDGVWVAYWQSTSQWAGAGGDFYTAIASITWTRAAAAASPPPPAVLQSATFVYADKRIAITFVRGGSSPASTAFTIQRSDDGGLTFPAVAPSLTHIPVTGATPVTVYDRLYTPGVPVTYRVLAYSGSVLVAATAPSNEVTVTPTDDRNMLRHPTNDLLDTVLNIKAPEQGEGIPVLKPRSQAIYYTLGGAGVRQPPLMTWGPRHGSAYDLTLQFDMISAPELWDAIEALEDASCPLFLQLSTGEALWVGMGPGATGRDTKDRWDAVPGNPTKVAWLERDVTLSEIQPPLFF